MTDTSTLSGSAQRVRLRFDPTINAGHLFQAVVAVLPLIVWGVRLESRVDAETDLRGRLEKKVEEVERRGEANMNRIERLLERIDQKMDRKVDKSP